MNSNEHNRKKRRFSATGLATVLLSASLAVAKSYDIAVDTMSLAAEAVDKTAPAYTKDADLREGEDGRVHLGLAVMPSSRAADPVVVSPVASAPCGSRNLYGSTIMSIVEPHAADGDSNQPSSRETFLRTLNIDEESSLSAETQRRLLTALEGVETA